MGGEGGGVKERREGSEVEEGGLEARGFIEKHKHWRTESLVEYIQPCRPYMLNSS